MNSEINSTYKVSVFCKNCDLSEDVNIEKGKTIEESACPKCGNYELEKISRPMRIIPHIENYR